MGFRNLYLPHVIAIHHESKTRGKPQGASYRQWKNEVRSMKKRWGSSLLHDRFYSPFLSLEEEDWSITLNTKSMILR